MPVSQHNAYGKKLAPNTLSISLTSPSPVAPSLEVEIKNLGVKIDMLGEALETLRQHLEPCFKPSPPELHTFDPKADTGSPTVRSPLGMTVRAMSEEVQQLIDLVSRVNIQIDL